MKKCSNCKWFVRQTTIIGSCQWVKFNSVENMPYWMIPDEEQVIHINSKLDSNMSEYCRAFKNKEESNYENVA